MAEYSTPEERTEAPTDRRMGQLRREGQLFSSHDVTSVVSLITGFMLLTYSAESLRIDIQGIMRDLYLEIGHGEVLTLTTVSRDLMMIMRAVFPDLLFITAGVALMSSLSVMLQTDWNVREKWVKFRWEFLNPIAGVKRIVSIAGVVNTLKALLKLCMILPVAFFALKSFAPQMVELIHMSIEQILVYTGFGIGKIFWRIMYILIGFAAFDYIWGKFQWLKQNRMTKDEVKDERKAMEGDEDTKRRIQQKGLQRIMQRIRQTVPKADVVITNPTHLSVALKYDRTTMRAPTVVAKGAGHLAMKIREIAREAGVPVIERKPVARALYESVEVGGEIPHQLFKAVAEILAYVYKLKNPHWRPAKARSETHQ